jgi:hypothetical protein
VADGVISTASFDSIIAVRQYLEGGIIGHPASGERNSYARAVAADRSPSLIFVMKTKGSQIAAISLGLTVAGSILGVVIPFLSDLLAQWAL